MKPSRLVYFNYFPVSLKKENSKKFDSKKFFQHFDAKSTFSEYSTLFRKCQEIVNIFRVIIKITISSIVIGLKNSSLRLFTSHVVIGQFVIGQFSRPITFEAVV